MWSLAKLLEGRVLLWCLAVFCLLQLHEWMPCVEAMIHNKGKFGDVNISAILESVSAHYDKRIRPNYGGPPVEVGVTMYVLSISSLSEVQMDFTLDFYFRQFWTDPRLAFKKQPGVERLSVGSEFIKNIWVPDTFFVNEKASYFHTVTTNNEFIRIDHTGSITRSMRLTITASCPMNLQYFPMDRQLCHIEIESCGFALWSTDHTKISHEVLLKTDKSKSVCLECNQESMLQHTKTPGRNSTSTNRMSE